jgi:hypothetical protein
MVFFIYLILYAETLIIVMVHVSCEFYKFRHKVHKTVPKMIFICLYVAIKHQLLNFMIKKTSEMSIL